jgi:hypothetical protein
MKRRDFLIDGAAVPALAVIPDPGRADHASGSRDHRDALSALRAGRETGASEVEES